MKMTAAIKQFERWGDENRRLVSILILVSAFFVILYGINQLTESVVVYANDNPNAIAAEENIDNFGLIGEIFRKHDKYLSLRTLIRCFPSYVVVADQVSVYFSEWFGKLIRVRINFLWLHRAIKRT